MPGEKNRMDGNERFRQLVHNGNPSVLANLLAELGRVEAKKLIEECYRDQPETALVYSTKRAGDGKHRKDTDQLECVKVLISYGAQVNETDCTGRTALHWSCWYNNEPVATVLVDSGADPSLQDGAGHNCLHTAVTTGALDCVRLVMGRRKELLNRRGGENGVTPLLAAVQKGDANVVAALVTSGADVNCQEDTSKRTPLHYALYIKKKDLFEYLLQHGADITKTDHRGTTVLHRCCTIQDASFLRSVLSFGRSLPRKYSTHSPLSTAHTATPLGTALQMGDTEGATPVIVACQNGNLEQLTLLVEAGAPVSNKDKFQRCALHHCVENPATECAEYLLRAIPSLLSCADEEGLTPLHMAVIAGNVALVKLLLKRGANLQVVDNEKHTVVHWATVCGHADVLDLLIENGADVSSPDKHQAFPIHYAAQMMSKRGSGTDSASSGGEGSLHILKTLLKHKVSPEAEDKDKRTPILWAASAGSSAACRVLVSAGADVNRADKDDLTALHCAASRGHSACVETLIKNCKASVDPVDKNQCTPLFYATTLGHTDCVRVLLSMGADCAHTDTRGRTAGHCATVSGQTETLDILRRHNIDLWIRNLKGDLPLHEAAQAGHIDLVEYLLEHPARGQTNVVDAGNRDGRTCLHVASLTNNVWLCKVLIERHANVNAIMKNKGKYYSPYDVALIKGHSEAKEFLYERGGRPASHVTSHAATTIQVRFKYHQNKHRLRRQRKDKSSKGQKEDTESIKSAEPKEGTRKEELGEGINEEPGDEEGKTNEKVVNGDTEETPKQTPASPLSDHSATKEKIKETPSAEEGKGKKGKTSASKKQKKTNKEKSEDIVQEKEARYAEGNSVQTNSSDPHVSEKVPTGEASDGVKRPKSGKADAKSRKSPRDSSSSPSPSPTPRGKRRTPTSPSPKYVEKGTQITTGSTEVCINGETLHRAQYQTEKLAGNLELKESKESSPKEKETLSLEVTKIEKQNLSQAASVENVHGGHKNKTNKRETPKSQKSSRSSRKSIQKSRVLSPVPSAAHNIATQPKTPRSNRAENDDSCNVDSSKLQQEQSPEPKAKQKHKSDYSSDFESEKSYRSSSSSSSHSATSDIDSSSCERASKKKVRRSPVRRSAGSRTRKTPPPGNQPYSSDEENRPSKNKQNKDLTKDSENTESKPHLKQPKTKNTPLSEERSSKKSSTSSSRSSKSPKEQEEKIASQRVGQTNGSTRQSPCDSNKGDSRDPKEEASDMGFLYSKMKRPRRIQNGHKPSTEGALDSEDDKENQNMDIADDDQAYTDLEEMAEGRKGHEEDTGTTPRKRKTRPNKLIQSIQESVKRYERERQSIRQLHQVRRAQIYSGPTWDVALFRKIVEQHGKPPGQASQGDGTPQSACSSNAQTWEEYLKEQLKVIQDERKSASATRKANSAQPRDSSTTASAGHKVTPRSGVRRAGESSSPDGRARHHSPQEKPVKQNSSEGTAKSPDDRSITSNNNNTMNNNNNNNSNSNSKPNGMREPGAPVLRRAQTARGPRTPHSGENHQTTTTAPLDLSQHHSNPRWFTSREATRLRHELAQQQLIKAYRPSGGMELFRNNTFAHQGSRGWIRPQSTMSTRTTTSGNSLANGISPQSRAASREADYSTIMTSNGSRRVRTPLIQGEANTSQSQYSRPRHPLIFKDPDEYDKPKRKSLEQQGEGHPT